MLGLVGRVSCDFRGVRLTTAVRDWGWASLIKEDTCEPIVTTMSSVVGAVNQLLVGTAGARVGIWEWVLPFRREVVPWQKRGFLLACKECFLVFGGGGKEWTAGSSSRFCLRIDCS